VKRHSYEIRLDWTGNSGEGTRTYRGYRRDHTITAAGKPELAGSSDPAFRGDPSRYNPEELLIASLSACHMLSYLHVCAVNGVVVTGYADDAAGTMEETADGGGAFTEVTLHPIVTTAADSDEEKARSLHEEAHRLCFIASSVKFPVRHEARIIRQETPATPAGQPETGSAGS
jgi:organic hydroperoxide reductase OsmC/OhrA